MMSAPSCWQARCRAGFSAGFDLDILRGKSATECGRFLDKLYVELAHVQHALGKPSIAAVGGAARGGGMTLAISCDVLLAGESATFGYPEIDIGLVPAIHFVHLPRIVGRHRAFELLFSGRSFGADEAHSLGLVSRVVPDEHCATQRGKWPASLRAKSRTAMRLAPRRLHARERSRFPAQHRRRRGAVLQRRHDRRRAGRAARIPGEAGAALVATAADARHTVQDTRSSGNERGGGDEGGGGDGERPCAARHRATAPKAERGAGAGAGGCAQPRRPHDRARPAPRQPWRHRGRRRHRMGG